MALQTESPSTTPNPQVVANAFVEQYYHILHHSPELVHRFYQDSSVLSRPDSDGGMTLVTTMQDINDKILSMDYKNYKAEIRTADAQISYKEGVTVLVTGCLTDKTNLRRNFAQSFFLAPQDNGYFVLNDVFRFLENDVPLGEHPVKSLDNANQNSPIPEPEVPRRKEDKNVVEKANDVVTHEIQIADDRESVVKSQPRSHDSYMSTDAEPASSAQEDAPKISYASIVKVTKGNPGYAPTNTSKMAPKETESQPVGCTEPAPASESSSQNSGDGCRTGSSHEEAEGYSIYIRNLPFNITVSQLEAEFKKFGTIKREGIQIRNNKQQGYCFGFVEFLASSSRKDAIQASPMTILGREIVIEAKRTTSRADGERGRFSSSWGGYRNESFRGRGSYGGGRRFGRSDYRNWGTEPSGRVSGSSRRGETYQQVTGRGRSSSGPKQNANLNY